MRKFWALLLAIILLSGCSGQSEIQDNSVQTEISKSVYQRGFYEQEHITVPKIMYLEGSGNLKSFPYEEADLIKEIKDMYVIIHTVVRNDKGEDWALIENTEVVNVNNYGYIRVDKLSEKAYEPLYICEKEAISDVVIGDIVEKAIAQFGDKYEIHKTELGWSYAFRKDNGYVSIHFDPISNAIEEINLTAQGYKTKEGYQVSDKAINVLNCYKTKYEMNTDQRLFQERPESIFHLGDGYVIEFDYEPKELTEVSVITRIRYYNIYNGDW